MCVLLADPLHVSDHKIGETLPAAALRLLRSVGLRAPSASGRHVTIGGNLWAWGSPELHATDFLRDPDGPGWRLDRESFDTELRDQAFESGTVAKQAQLTASVRQGDRWLIEFDDGTYVSARWLIDATGRRAALARKFGAKRRRDAPLVAIYARGEPDAGFLLDRTLVEAVPNGWWYAARLPSGSPLAGFHIHPRDVARVRNQPEAWRRALDETDHLAPLLRSVRFHRPLRPLEAGGARMDRFTGEGWIACGDAALSFDPISSQGIFSALHGGMSAAQAVIAAEGGDRLAFEAYTVRLENIRRIYLARWHSLYGSETRWPGEPFWQRADNPPILSLEIAAAQ
jgi:flavin-dependent dehydrogenase